MCDWLYFTSSFRRPTRVASSLQETFFVHIAERVCNRVQGSRKQGCCIELVAVYASISPGLIVSWFVPSYKLGLEWGLCQVTKLGLFVCLSSSMTPEIQMVCEHIRGVKEFAAARIEPGTFRSKSERLTTRPLTLRVGLVLIPSILFWWIFPPQLLIFARTSEKMFAYVAY